MYCILIKLVEDVDAVYITCSQKGQDSKRFKENIQIGTVKIRIQESGPLESLDINIIKYRFYYRH